MSNYRERVLSLIENKFDRTGDASLNKSLLLIEYQLKIVSFISTLNSWRFDTLMRPYPSDFFDADHRKDFDRLTKLAAEIPSLDDMNESANLSDDCWRLIHWIFTFNSIELKLLDEREVKELYKSLKLNNENSFNLLPDYVFKVNSPSARIRHNRLKADNGFVQAFHGTKWENVFSIIHNGLVNNMNKRDVFGSGTYLSNLNVAITFSPYSYVKSNCSIKRLSCVLLCEIVLHPSMTVKENHPYYLVKDDDFLNVTHLFIYCKLENQKRKISKFDLLLILLGLFVLFYSFYKTNKKY